MDWGVGVMLVYMVKGVYPWSSGGGSSCLGRKLACVKECSQCGTFFGAKDGGEG